MARLTGVNAKTVWRLMWTRGLNPRRRRRFVRTTDSDQGGPIHSFMVREFEVQGPEQVCVAELTYVAIRASSAPCNAAQTCSRGTAKLWKRPAPHVTAVQSSTAKSITAQAAVGNF